MSKEPRKLLRARPFCFPPSLTKDPYKAKLWRLDICRRLGGPAWSLKRCSDLSALIDGHKPLGSTPRVGKEVPPRQGPFHMLILGYKYSRGAEERQRACRDRERPTTRVPPPRPCPRSVPGRPGWITMTAAATASGVHKLSSTKEERKVGLRGSPRADGCWNSAGERWGLRTSRKDKHNICILLLYRCFL